MKFRKALTIAAAFIIVLLLGGWLLRNALIQRFSGPLLAKFDIELVDVSLDALATSKARIGYLELVHAKGTTVTIEGLTLPIGRAADGSRTYTAEKVSVITATRSEGEPFELARLIDQYLLLPEYLADSDIKVATFSMPPYPAAHNLQWTVTQNDQTLRATIASMELEIGTTGITEREYEMRFAIDVAKANERFVTGHLRRNNAGIAIAGGASIELSAWEHLVKMAGIVPDPVTMTSGTALLEYEVDIPYDTNESPSVAAALSPSAELGLGYANGDTSLTSIVVTSATPLTVSATFPAVEWQLQQDEAAIRVSYEDFTDIPLRIFGLTCTSENRCTMNSELRMAPAELPSGRVERISLTSRQTFDFSTAAPRLELHAGGKMTASGLKVNDVNIGSWDATLTSAASLEIVPSGWKFDASSVAARLESLSVSDNLLLSGPLVLEEASVASLDNVTTAVLELRAPNSRLKTGSHDILMPGLQGSVAQRGDDIEFSIATIDLYENGKVQGQYSLDNGHGNLAVADLVIAFTETPLSAWTSRWNQDWDLVAGTVGVSGQVAWLQNGAGSLSGPINIGAADLAGYFGDTAFTGLSTDLQVMYDGKGSATVMPSSASVELIDVGLPLRNITADYAITPDFSGADVANLRMNAFDGVISADPFSVRTDKGSNTVMVRAESLKLSDILTLKEFDAVEVSGRIGAELPITISSEGITIAAGSLTGEAPGGVIRYLSGNLANQAVNRNIDSVRQALSHFEYDTLTSKLSYSQEGDLELAMQLKGRNPDMEGSRPVILNLNVQNNVPQMLKSLQAARAVEELLERQLAE